NVARTFQVETASPPTKQTARRPPATHRLNERGGDGRGFTTRPPPCGAPPRRRWSLCQQQVDVARVRLCRLVDVRLWCWRLLAAQLRLAVLDQFWCRDDSSVVAPIRHRKPDPTKVVGQHRHGAIATADGQVAEFCCNHHSADAPVALSPPRLSPKAT